MEGTSTRLPYKLSRNIFYHKWFKSINIQDRDWFAGAAFTNFKWLVNMINKPIKQASINGLCQCIPWINCLDQESDEVRAGSFLYNCQKHDSYIHTWDAVSFWTMFSCPARILRVQSASIRLPLLHFSSFAACETAVFTKPSFVNEYYKKCSLINSVTA